MSPSDASHKFADLVSIIGGPPLDLSSIESFSDLEAGKLLLDWLTTQLDFGSGDDATPEGDTHDEEKENRRLFASIQDVVLEEDEVLILNRAKSSEARSIAEQTSSPPSDYMPPSRLKRHAEYINKEADLVQREADLIRARILQTKEASKKITQSIKLLQRAVFELDSNARRSEERISEISVNADTTIASTLNNAHDLLRDLGFPGRNKENLMTSANGNNSEDPATISSESAPDLESARGLLLNIQNELSSITTNLRQNLEDFTLLREQETVRILDLQAEVDRLQKAFSPANDKTNSVKAMKARRGSAARTDDHRLTKELEDICVLLEREAALKESGDTSGNNTLEALLSELDETHRMDSGEDKELSVQEILRQAWSLDQAAILKLHEQVLDEALTSLDTASLPLEQLHVSLSGLANCVQDTEAVLEALGEELGDIYLPDNNARGGNQDKLQEEDLERQLKDILGDLKDLRPSDAVPMLLLTRDDILAELRSLTARSNALELSERSWADDLIHQHSIRPLHPALTQIYAHSPLNTSPPFSFPADVQELEAQTRAKTKELQNLTNSLEEETRETFAKQSNLKRLTAFVNKWSGTAVAVAEP